MLVLSGCSKVVCALNLLQPASYPKPLSQCSVAFFLARQVATFCTCFAISIEKDSLRIAAHHRYQFPTEHHEPSRFSVAIPPSLLKDLHSILFSRHAPRVA